MSERTIISFDYAIKTVLRDKANFDILEGFLSELLGRQVAVIELLESEGNKDSRELKVNRIDLKAKIDDGEMAIFEIQFSDKLDFFGKVLYNACKAVVEQIKEGGCYNIKKLYMINIAYFELGAEKEYLFNAKISGFKGVHFGEVIPFAQKNELAPPESFPIDIHPEYYLILPKKFDEEIRGRFDEWIYVLKNSAIKGEFTAAGIKEAGKKLDRLKMTPSERKAYERYVEDMMDINSTIKTAEMKGEARGLKKGEAMGMKKGEAMGMKKGEAMGMKKGEAKGLKKGEARGRAEEKIEIAKAMKAKGMDANTISEMTGLPAADVFLL
ncbi:MAG: Rpn family recombination-promoting nuclease/putative transposase [Chitinispirillales bacterium]|jgi:predicted transposase/invertase (TIGR01784 family)|nr:Rpn family recombination-promoting nuclease/putative transposase [Chitinispirillales bacterium]